MRDGPQHPEFGWLGSTANAWLKFTFNHVLFGVSRQTTHVLVKPCGNSNASERVFTKNVVYWEVLRAQWGKY